MDASSVSSWNHDDVTLPWSADHNDVTLPGCDLKLGTDLYTEFAEDRWMPSPVTAEGSGRDREIPAPDIPRR